MNRYTDKQPPVIILGGGQIALSVVRALGKNKIPCFVIDDIESIANYSRYNKKIKRLQDKSSVNWLDYLLDHGKKADQKFVIISCCDEGLKLVAENRSELEKYYILQESNDEVTLAMLDKYKTYQLAEALNIPAPKVWNIESIRDLDTIIDSINFPCALKPRVSHEFTNIFHGIKLIKVNNKNELYTYYQQTQKYDLKMLVTELIPLGANGYDGYYTHLDENGNPLFHFTKLRIRQQPNLYGLGTYNVTNWNPEAMELGLKFLKGIGLRGIGTLEFIRDARDGQLKLLECNPRFTGTTELLHKAGLNWVLFVYNRLVGLPTPPMDYYKKGVYIIKLLPDFLAYQELKKNKKITFFKWIKSLLHIQHFYIFDWRDPIPFFVRIIIFWKQHIIELYNKLNFKKIYYHKSLNTIKNR